MSGFQTLLYGKANGTAWVSFNRPRVLNAYNVEMRDELFQVLQAIRDDPEVAVAVFRGQGRAFCAGADLTEFGTAPSLAVARAVRFDRDIWGMFLSIAKPLIAAIHGYCLGSGVEIAMLCDIRLASQDAVFGMPEVFLGMIPAAGGTQTLPRHVGVPRALELLLTRSRLSAHQALEMGLVDEVLGGDTLGPRSEAVARAVAALPPGVARATKEAVWHGLDLPLEQALDLEERLALGAMLR